MREKLIRALSYPRFLMRDYLDLDDCAFHGTYDRNCPQCRACNQEPECQWLVSNDEFAALEGRPLVELIRAVEVAITYVDARVAFWDHDRRMCACDACRWLRSTHHLLDESGRVSVSDRGGES